MNSIKPIPHNRFQGRRYALEIGTIIHGCDVEVTVEVSVSGRDEAFSPMMESPPEAREVEILSARITDWRHFNNGESAKLPEPLSIDVDELDADEIRIEALERDAEGDDEPEPDDGGRQREPLDLQGGREELP